MAGPAPMKLGWSPHPKHCGQRSGAGSRRGRCKKCSAAPRSYPLRYLAASGISGSGRKDGEGRQRESALLRLSFPSFPYPVCERIIPVLASYHLQVKTISRADGRSAIAAAAYRSAEMIYCDREGRSHDYTRKRGVAYLEIITPENAPQWAQDRAQLWNHAEAAEKRKNAVTAREWEIALPAELNPEDRKQLALSFANDLVEKFGVVADVAIHAPHRDGDQRNHHAHILTTTRRIEEGGFTVKTRELDDRRLGSQNIIDMRAHWAYLQNAALERSGANDRVDHRSLEAQREEAEQERDKLQERVTELESVIDGYAMQLVEPNNLKRMDSIIPRDQVKEWDTVQRAEWDRKTAEQQLHFAMIKAAELDRAPQIKLGPSASAMERQAMQRAREHGMDYEPATERGEQIQQTREQLSLADEARERVDAARTTYREARDLGFSRTRSAYVAAREALLFGVEQDVKRPTPQHHLTQEEPATSSRLARLKARRMDREQHQHHNQERETTSSRELGHEQETSMWDALDDIGRELPSPHDRVTTNDAMKRIEERTTEQQKERELEAVKIERERQEREQAEQYKEQSLDFGPEF